MRLTIIVLIVLFATSFGDHRVVHAQSPIVALIGDLQKTGQIEFFREDNEEERQALLKKLSTEPMQSLILLGDMTFWGVSIDDWKYVDTLLQPIHDRGIPMYPILGNHEYFIDGETAIENVTSRFPWFTTTWYSRVIDSVGYVFLNTNTSDLGLVEMREQFEWYLRTMHDLDADNSVRFVVVCGHHPPFTNSTLVDPEETFEKYFVPRFQRSSKAAFWFSGHCHSYERFLIGGKQFVVSGGGGGPRQKLLSADEAPFHDEFSGGEIRDLHYCLLWRSDNTMTMRMVPLDESPGVPRDNVTVSAP